jgi:hypothetical protein
MPQPAAVSAAEYWTFLCAAALLAITFAVPRNFGGGSKLSRRPDSPRFYCRIRKTARQARGRNGRYRRFSHLATVRGVRKVSYPEDLPLDLRDSAFGRRKDRLEERAEATILVGAEEQASLPVGNRLGCWAMQAIPLARGLKAPAPQGAPLFGRGCPAMWAPQRWGRKRNDGRRRRLSLCNLPDRRQGPHAAQCEDKRIRGSGYALSLIGRRLLGRVSQDGIR